jgi:hypothetical protein
MRVAPAIAAAGGMAITATAGNRTTPTIPSTPTTEATSARAKARRGGGRALGTHAQRGKGAAPGQLKAPGSPARGKALGAGKVKVRRPAPAQAQPPLGRIEHKPAKPTNVKHSSAKSPGPRPPPRKRRGAAWPDAQAGRHRNQEALARIHRSAGWVA